MPTDMMIALRMVLGGLVVVVLFTVAPALGQQIDIQAPTPERPRQPLITPPGDHFQMTRPTDADYYPSPPRVNYDPAFIEPASTKIETPTSTGRMGLAGWVSPNTPIGSEASGWRGDTGWFALGFAIEWGGPPAPPTKRPPSR